MPRIYDYYGARDPDRRRISDLISETTGIMFHYYESPYIGTYCWATGEPGQEVKVLPNETEDKDGVSLRWPEWAEYKTIVNSMAPPVPGTESPPFLDNLREKLSGVAELTFLRRSQPFPQRLHRSQPPRSADHAGTLAPRFARSG